jgi:hypothetical protein
MSRPFKTLAARREALIARSEQQRAALRAAAAELERSLAFVDRAAAAVARIKREPLLAGLTAAAIALLVLSRRGALKWISYAATAYSLTRRVRALLSGTQR